MAKETDKAKRNADIEAALGEGTPNLTAAAKVRKKKVRNKETGRLERVVEVESAAEFKAVKMPSMDPNSRSAKRARLKASRAGKRINHTAHYEHKTGKRKCGNIGCKTCRPEFNLKKRTMGNSIKISL
jgi:hypothetical protein